MDSETAHQAGERQKEASEVSRPADVRNQAGKGKLPCGARYCHRCGEECGVLVNAYILRDLAEEMKSACGG